VSNDRMRSSNWAGCLNQFLRVFAAGVNDDYGTPILGENWNMPGSKDDLRYELGDKLWQCCDLDTVDEELRDAEKRALSNWGSSSWRPPWDIPVLLGDSIKHQVDKVLVAHPGLRLNTKAAESADRFLNRLFYSVKGGPLVPSSLAVAATSFDNSKSLGFPRFGKDKSMLGDYFDVSQSYADHGFPLEDALRNPGLIGARSVSRGRGLMSKSRFITQWSRLLGNWEKTLFIPLFARLSQLPTFCAWGGQTWTDTVVTKFMKAAEGPMWSLDFTGFDASVPFEVINRVFRCIRSWFDSASGPLVDFVQAGFTGSGLFVPGRYIDGSERKRGVPSGSVLTNLIDSLVNLWVMEYSAALNKAHVDMSLVNGDDGVYTFTGIPDFNLIAETLLSELGMVVKMEPHKNLISRTRVMYLQMHHSKLYEKFGVYVGVRPICRAYMNTTTHEHAPAGKIGWNKKYNAYRELQQVNNCANHPRFDGALIMLWSADGYIKEALERIVRRDPEVAIANALLDVGQGERGKLPVDDLLWSPVVQRLVALRAKGSVR